MAAEMVSARAVPMPAPACGGCRFCLWLREPIAESGHPAPGEMGTDLLLKRPSDAGGVPRTVAVLRRPWLRLEAHELGLACRPQDPLWRTALAVSPEARVSLSGVAEFRGPCDAEAAMRAHLGGAAEEWAIRFAGGATITAHFAISRMEAAPGIAGEGAYRLELACEDGPALLP